MIEEGYGRATHILACLGEGNSFLAEARRRGLAIVSDMTIALSSDAIVAKEAEQFPSWSDAPHWKMIRDNDILLSCTSLFLCPSDFVQRDLVENFSVDVKKTCVLPYHVPAAFFGVKSAPQVGRILFAGTADLRKGIHYLAMAADILRSRGRRYDFRVAGNASAAVRSQEIARNLRFLGRLPRDQVRAEFEAADVLVLPTLAEGSAGVTYEALGAGIPVITTAAAGSIVRDGRDGFIVAERDPVALADRVEELVEDRALRERMGAAARLHASQYTASNYSKRLIEAVVATKGSAPC